MARWGGTLQQRRADVLTHFKKDPNNLPIRWEQYASEYLERYQNTKQALDSSAQPDPEYLQRLLNNHRAITAQLPDELKIISSPPGAMLADASSSYPELESLSSLVLTPPTQEPEPPKPLQNSPKKDQPLATPEQIAAMKLQAMNQMLANPKTREQAIQWANSKRDRYSIEYDPQGEPICIFEINSPTHHDQLRGQS